MKTSSLLRLTFAGVVISVPTLAHAADERITLSLIGAACSQGRAALDRKLIEVPGVRQINLHAAPNHILIGTSTAVVDVELLVIHVNAILATHPPCHTTIMNACLSADRHVTSSLDTREPSSIAPFSQ